MEARDDNSKLDEAFSPDYAFSPGEFIKEEIEYRGWTEEDLANNLKEPLFSINHIIQGKKAITPDIAKKLGAFFGTDPKFWMNLEKSWQNFCKKNSTS